MPHISSSISLTPETHQHLLEKRDLLVQNRDEERIELQAIFRDEKDPIGSSPLDDAHRRIDHLDGQIDELNGLISNAVIVDDDATSELTVTVGKRIVISQHPHGTSNYERLEIVIDGFNDGSEDGTSVVTPDSPIGAAVIGAKLGEERQYRVPSGGLIQLVIVSVSQR